MKRRIKFQLKSTRRSSSVSERKANPLRAYWETEINKITFQAGYGLIVSVSTVDFIVIPKPDPPLEIGPIASTAWAKNKSQLEKEAKESKKYQEIKRERDR